MGDWSRRDISAAGSIILAAVAGARPLSVLAVPSADAAPVDIDLPTDGVTDIAPLIQEAYDSGQALVRLGQNQTYAWNSPVFLDQVQKLDGLVIEGNRSIIRLGPDLPRSTWSRSSSTQFAIFPGTLRSALVGGVVTVSDATRSTMSGGAFRALTVRDLTIDGQGTNSGFSYANRTPVTLENVILYQARVASTWWSYTDQNTYIACYSRAGSGPAGQVLIDQVTPGDGLIVLGGKADAAVGFASLVGCRGAVISGLVTASLVLQDCSGISIVGMHHEGQSSRVTGLKIRTSQVSISASALYENYDPTVPTIDIDDSASTQSGSEVVLNEVISVQLLTEDTATAEFAPLIRISTAMDDTRVVARGLKGMVGSSGAAGRWVDGVQPAVRGSSTTLTAALTSNAGRAAIATGTFQVRHGDNSWSVDTQAEQLFLSKRLLRPSVLQVVTETAFSGGTIPALTSVTYAVSIADALGNSTDVSAEVAIVVGSTGMTRLQVRSPAGSGTLTLWRRFGPGASTAPDSYIVLPIRSNRTTLHDMGDVIAGRPWIRTSVPTPPTANKTVAKLVINNTAYPA